MSTHKIRRIKGYVLVVPIGIVLLATVVLVVLQWGNAASFSLYGRNLTPHTEGGKTVGGVNTALLMVLSAVGGLVVVWLCKVFVYGLRAVWTSGPVQDGLTDAQEQARQ